MKVVFISSDFQDIVQLPDKDYPETVEFYQSILDFRTHKYGYNALDEVFLRDCGNWRVYVRTSEEDVHLTYLGEVQTKYKEAIRFFKGEMTSREIELLDIWFYYTFQKGKEDM